MKSILLSTILITTVSCGVDYEKKILLPPQTEPIVTELQSWCSPKDESSHWVMKRLTYDPKNPSKVELIRSKTKDELRTSALAVVDSSKITLVDFHSAKHLEDSMVPKHFTRTTTPEKVLEVQTTKDPEFYFPCSSFSQEFGAAKENETLENYLIEKSFTRGELHKEKKNVEVYGKMAFPSVRRKDLSRDGFSWCSLEKDNDYQVTILKFIDEDLFISRYTLPLGLANKDLPPATFEKTFSQADRFKSGPSDAGEKFSTFTDSRDNAFLIKHQGESLTKTAFHKDIFYNCLQLFKRRSYFDLQAMNRQQFESLIKRESILMKVKPELFLDMEDWTTK
ncbi:MAG TPA: hypothetical protein VNJ01_13040 [Bacteriovoracaceae bacterium]|nr:hypothetical protein [Bacteriovoracaceae bacterium]